MISSKAVVLATLALATTAALTPAFAQEQRFHRFGPGGPEQRLEIQRDQHFRLRAAPGPQQRLAQRSPLLPGFTCSPRGAERLENGFERLGAWLDLDEAQAEAFDALRTDVLTQQTSFADACPQPQAGTAPTPVERLEARQQTLTAEAAALEAVLPAFTAFYGSLSDEQKARLEPRRRDASGDTRGDRPGADRFPALPHRL